MQFQGHKYDKQKCAYTKMLGNNFSNRVSFQFELKWGKLTKKLNIPYLYQKKKRKKHFELKEAAVPSYSKRKTYSLINSRVMLMTFEFHNIDIYRYYGNGVRCRSKTESTF